MPPKVLTPRVSAFRLADAPVQREGISFDETTTHASVWRVCSAAFLPGGLNLDFSHQGGKPLRDAAKKFVDLTILTDHSRSVTDWIGRVADAWWDEGDASLGLPPGINALYLIHRGKAQASGQLLDGTEFGAVRSTSAGLTVQWVPSHPRLSEQSFFERLGTKVNGEIVRPLVTDVLTANEVSLVWKGQDPNAQKLAVNRAVIPGATLSADLFFTTDPATTPRDDEGDQLHGGTTTMDPKKLAALLGWADGELTEDKLEIALAAYKDKTTTARLTQVENEKKELDTKLATAATTIEQQAAKINELEPRAKIGDAALTAERKEAVRLFNLVNGTGDEHKALREQIETSGYDVVLAHKATYGKLADAKLGKGRAAGAESDPAGDGKKPVSTATRTAQAEFADSLYPKPKQ